MGVGLAAEDADGAADVLVAVALARERPALPPTRRRPLQRRSAWRCSSWARSHSRRWRSRIRLGSLLPGRSPGSTSSSSATRRRSSRTSTTSCIWRAARSVLRRTSRRCSRSTGAPPISLSTWNDAWLVFVMAILPIGLYLLYRAYATASPATSALARAGPPHGDVPHVHVVGDELRRADRPVLALHPDLVAPDDRRARRALTALIGLAVTRRARGSVGDLVVELERAGPGGVRSALAERSAIRRSSLRSGYPNEAPGRTSKARGVSCHRAGPGGDLRRRTSSRR